MYLAQVYITLKEGVLDPQGNTIQKALEALGFSEVTEVRAGKYFEIGLEAKDEGEARKRLEEMCARLLANPVLEQYTFKLTVL